MTVFISHDFEDKGPFENVTDALEREGLTYWQTRSIQAGEPLADQLRTAILSCGVCVFVATARSVKSVWCLAELGAFWGAGKKVLIYQSDSTLTEAKLPPQFRGHYMESRLTSLVDAIRRSVNNEPGSPPGTDSLTPQDLRDLVESALARALRTHYLRTTFHELAEVIDLQSGQTVSAGARALLSQLLLRTEEEVTVNAAETFPFSFVVETSTGTWRGYAREQVISGPEHAPDVVVQKRCLLVRFDDRGRTIAAGVVQQVLEGHNRGVMETRMPDPIAVVGRGEIGRAVPDQHH